LGAPEKPLSAIFGILRFDGAPALARDLERMSAALVHRGPDGHDVIVDGSVGLGHSLMRVNKEDQFEAQPLRDRDADVTLVADARIDNREDLADAFGIATPELRDLPDSALIMCAYKKWGEDCAEHLIGDFAFAIWDGRLKKLVLSRDHMGQRYVHYHLASNFFVFATETEALWAAGVPRRLSETAIGRHLLLSPAPANSGTLFEGIRAVLGGSILTVQANGMTSDRRYWKPHADPAFLNRAENDYVERYRSVLTEAVECRIRRLIAPPALCFSAGYDTAAIAGLSRRVLEEQGRKLIAFSSVMPEGYDGPLPHARRWVELCRRDMPHLDVRYHVRGDESDLDGIEELFRKTGAIPDHVYTVPDVLFQRAAAAGPRLVMDGLGGDVTINPRGGHALRHLLRRRQFWRFLIEARAQRRLYKRSLRQILFGDVMPEVAPIWLRRIYRRLRRGLIAPWEPTCITPQFAEALIALHDVDPAEMPSALSIQSSRRSVIHRAVDLWTEMAFTTTTPLAAAHGLDLTRPMIDKRVVEFGLAIPESFYVRNGRHRYLACRALADVYPREFQDRRPNQDPIDPDRFRRLRTQMPALKAQIEELAKDTTLIRYIDFERMQAIISGLTEQSAVTAEIAHALRAFYTARYVVWFRGVAL
jgi:asparagine synthase (glutamine-hydrolysing)